MGDTISRTASGETRVRAAEIKKLRFVCSDCHAATEIWTAQIDKFTLTPKCAYCGMEWKPELLQQTAARIADLGRALHFFGTGGTPVLIQFLIPEHE